MRRLSISFIDEDQIFEQNIKKCPICKNEYLKLDFKQCDKCLSENCLRCTILAGTLGNFCVNCYNKLEKHQKEKIRKKSNQLKFWAKSGYYVFIILMIIAVFSFSLMALSKAFFIIGLIVVIVDCLYGWLLYKFLSQS